MRRLIDIVCDTCEEIQEDKFVDLDELAPHTCGGHFKRIVLQHAAAVHGDDIPGGMLIKNGLCHPDGTPKRYYTKSAIAREAKARGYHNHVTHVTAPGTDKNPHTQRFV